MLSNNVFFSLEAVAHQSNKKFFEELVADVERFRKDFKEKKYTNYFERTKKPEKGYFSDVIKKHTRIPMQFYASEYECGNMAVMPPDIDRNHPLLTPNNSAYYTGRDRKAFFKSKENVMSGSVDLYTGKVDGEWTKVPVHLFINIPMLTSDLFTAREMAAIVLHEVGHVFTYYEYLGVMVSTNHVLGDIYSAWTGEKDYKRRVDVLRKVKNTNKLEQLDVERLAESDDAESVCTLVVSNIAVTKHSATGTELFDHRTWEAMSDQFSARMGSEMDLFTALDKLNRLYGMSSYWSSGKHLLVNLISLPFMMLYAPFILIIMLMIKPFDIYDRPGERLLRIRNEAVTAIKNTKLPKDVAIQYSNDIEKMDIMLKEVNDRDSWYSWIWKHLTPSVRKQEKRREIIQELEALANNDLFVASNKLRNL